MEIQGGQASRRKIHTWTANTKIRTRTSASKEIEDDSKLHVVGQTKVAKTSCCVSVVRVYHYRDDD